MFMHTFVNKTSQIGITAFLTGDKCFARFLLVKFVRILNKKLAS